MKDSGQNIGQNQEHQKSMHTNLKEIRSMYVTSKVCALRRARAQKICLVLLGDVVFVSLFILEVRHPANTIDNAAPMVCKGVAL